MSLDNCFFPFLYHTACVSTTQKREISKRQTLVDSKAASIKALDRTRVKELKTSSIADNLTINYQLFYRYIGLILKNLFSKINFFSFLLVKFDEYFC